MPACNPRPTRSSAMLQRQSPPPLPAGKSTLWEVLEKAYERVGRKPVLYKMNPKAMPRQQLLGSMNLDTREW